jgi:hypothetical protein
MKYNPRITHVGRDKALPFPALYGLACNASLMQAYLLSFMNIYRSLDPFLDSAVLHPGYETGGLTSFFSRRVSEFTENFKTLLLL